MVKVHSLSRLPHRLLSLLASIAMLFAIVPAVSLLTAVPANAAGLGGFEDNDGNLIHDSATDWADVSGSPTFSAKLDLPSGTSDNSYGQGAKENDTSPAVVAGSIPNNKADLTRDYVYASKDANGHLLVDLAYETASFTGSAHIDFELNQSSTIAANGVNPVRTTGDVLITYDWNGSSAVAVGYATWLATNKWSAVTDFPAGQGEGASNTTTVHDPIAGVDLTAGEFGEAGVDLTAAGLVPAGQCVDFASVLVKSRSSGESFQAELKDFIEPNDVSISNCSPVHIKKVGPGTSTTGLAGATFTIAPKAGTGTPAVPSGQSPCTTDATGYCKVGDPAADPLVFPGTYIVTETGAPSGYMLPSTLTYEISVPQSTDLVVHDPLGDVTVNKTEAGSGDTVTGAGWTLTATAGVAYHNGTNPDTYTILDADTGTNSDGNADGTVQFTNLLTGTYTLSESTVPNGYTKHADVTGILIEDSAGNRHVTENLTDTKAERSLTVHKTNLAGDQDIANATFQLWRESNGTAGLQSTGDTPDTLIDYTCTTGSDGTCTSPYTHATWDNLYYWVETSVPWPFTVPDDNVFGPVHVTANNVDDGLSTTEVGDPLAELSTLAGDDQQLSGAPAQATVTDSATLSGIRTSATGVINWYLFKGNTCTEDPTVLAGMTPVDSADVTGPGTYGPASTTVTEAGTYHWVAVYETGNQEGDELIGSCTDSNEQVVVSPAQPTIVTVATSADTVDGTISDTATVSGLAEPLSTQNPPTVTFTVYTDNTCDTTAPGTHTWTVDAQDNGDGTATATSGDYQLTNEFGTYYWTATFSGDSNNADITDSNCGKVDERTGDNEVSHAPVLDSPHKVNDPGTATDTDPTVSIYPSGNHITYTITAHNSGDATMTGVTVTDTVSDLADYNGDAACDSSGDQTGCSADDSAAPDLQWTFDLPAGGTAVLTFSVTVDPTDVNGADITNIANVTNGTTTKPTDETHNPVAFPVLAIAKDANPLPREDGADGVVAPGDTIHYDVTVSNSGEAAADGVLVTDSVPAGTTYTAGSIDCTGTCTPDDSGAPDLAWTVDVPAAGEGGDGVVHVSFDVTVDAGDANGFIVANHAHYSWPTGVDTEPFQSDDSRTITHIVEFPILNVTKTANPPSGSIVQHGDQIDYTLTVTNSGLAAAPGTVVTDTLPANVTVVDGSFNVEPDSIVDGVITWTVDVPAAGEGPGQVVLTYSVTVNSDAPQGSDLVNTVLVNGECNPVNGDVCETHHHVPTGDLTLVKFVNGQDRVTAKYGDTLTYTFDAATTGKLDQTNVHVTDVVPTGTTYVDGSAGCSDAGQCDATYDSATRTVTWALGDMAAGTTRHLVFKVTIDTPQADANGGLPPETIFNAGVIGSTETQDTPSNKVRADIVAVLGEKVVKTTKPPQVLPFTGAVLPLRAAGLVALLMIGVGAALSSTRRRRRS